MDLLEYQAKKLFREVGIPVLPSQQISDSREIKQLQVPYPIVLKSQVRAGGRGKAGGIRFVENTIDAIAATQTILNLPINGEYPQLLLAEARYDALQEVFLAIVLDYKLKRPVLLGSAQGGINVENLLDTMQTVVVKDDFSPWYARRLAILMGLQGQMIETISTIVGKMYHLFLSKDLDSIEINPLGIREHGDVMALDGKIALNNRALVRHPGLCAEFNGMQDEETAFAPQPQWLRWNHSQGNVGILSNSLGLTATICDALAQKSVKPCHCLVIDAETAESTEDESQSKRDFEQALKTLLEDSAVTVILVNVLGSLPFLTQVQNAIARLFTDFNSQGGEDRIERPTAIATRRTRRTQTPQKSILSALKSHTPIVLRCMGEMPENTEDLFPQEGSVYCTNNLNEALDKTIAWAKEEEG